MLKLAYQLGVKLAVLEEGIHLDGDSPADELAAALQKIPDPGQDTEDPETAIGDPGNASSFGDRSVNYAFDDLSHLGLDIQGPDSTAI